MGRRRDGKLSLGAMQKDEFKFLWWHFVLATAVTLAVGRSEIGLILLRPWRPSVAEYLGNWLAVGFGWMMALAAVIFLGMFGEYARREWHEFFGEVSGGWFGKARRLGSCVAFLVVGGGATVAIYGVCAGVVGVFRWLGAQLAAYAHSSKTWADFIDMAALGLGFISFFGLLRFAVFCYGKFSGRRSGPGASVELGATPQQEAPPRQ